MPFDKSGASWFALHVRRNHEKVVGRLLAMKGYEQFVPTYKVSRRWSDRVKTLDKPLFPGYVFCRYDLAIGSTIVTTPGVIRVLGAGGLATSVGDLEIAAIQRLAQADVAVEPCAYPSGNFAVAQRVRIEAGPFAGLDAVVVRTKSGQRLVVSINAIQRSIVTELDAALLSPVKKHTTSVDDNPASPAVYAEICPARTLNS